MRNLCCYGFFFLYFCICCGCTPSPTVPVSGSVTLDGNILPEGSIKFFYGDQIPAGVGKISEGKFQFESKPVGKVRVEITAVKEVTAANRDDESNVPYKQYLPAIYNLQSTLTAEVTREGKNEYDFSLKSQPR